MAESQEVWLVRHAETEWSRTGKHTGLTDIELTEAGRARAREMGERLAGHPFGLVLSSPLQRARETAQLAGLGDPGITDDLLEWDYGEYEGLTTQEVAAVMARGNLDPDRDAAESALVELVASGAALRTPLGDDALWSPRAPVAAAAPVQQAA